MQVIAVFLLLSACCAGAASLLSQIVPLIRQCCQFCGPVICSIGRTLIKHARAVIQRVASSREIPAAPEDLFDSDSEDEEQPIPRPKRRYATNGKIPSGTISSDAGFSWPGAAAHQSGGRGIFSRIAMSDSDDEDMTATMQIAPQPKPKPKPRPRESPDVSRQALSLTIDCEGGVRPTCTFAQDDDSDDEHTSIGAPPEQRPSGAVGPSAMRFGTRGTATTGSTALARCSGSSIIAPLATSDDPREGQRVRSTSSSSAEGPTLPGCRFGGRNRRGAARGS